MYKVSSWFKYKGAIGWKDESLDICLMGRPDYEVYVNVINAHEIFLNSTTALMLYHTIAKSLCFYWFQLSTDKMASMRNPTADDHHIAQQMLPNRNSGAVWTPFGFNYDPIQNVVTCPECDFQRMISRVTRDLIAQHQIDHPNCPVNLRPRIVTDCGKCSK
jgi:hypothetical protein